MPSLSSDMDWGSKMSEVKIYEAVAKAIGQIKRVGKDNRNTEQKYDFASIDDFMAMLGPICAANGLVTVIDEDMREFVEKPGKYGATQWVSIIYQITTWHISGEKLPTVRRHVEVVRNGPQAYGAAQSYVLKQYYRALFVIPTGDNDDPDHGTTPEELAGQNSRREPIKMISAEQFQEIKALMESTDTEEAKICEYLNVNDLKGSNIKQAANAIAVLKKKQAKIEAEHDAAVKIEAEHDAAVKDEANGTAQ